MRAPMLVAVAAVSALLIWLLGSPLLGRSNADRRASDAVLTAPASSRAHPPEAAGSARRVGAGIQRAPTGATHMYAQHARTPIRSAEAVSLLIPRIAVRVPVIDRGVDAQGNLPIAKGRAVTHYSFSAGAGAVGNYVAYGHDDIQGSVFRHLDALRIGDPIELVSGDRRYLYRVTTSRVVPPTDLSVLKPTPNATMTLISCTPYMVDTQRIVVDAALEGVEGL